MDNREIDKLIAEKVMGWTEIRESGFTGFDFVGVDPKHKPTDWYLILHYSTDISAAWRVVEKLKEQFVIILWPNSNIAQFCHKETEEYLADIKTDDMSLSVCLAALKAVGVEIEADSGPHP